MTNSEYRIEAALINRVSEVICQIDLDGVLRDLEKAEKQAPDSDPELFKEAREPLARFKALVLAILDVRKARWEMNVHQADSLNDRNAVAAARFAEMLRK